MMNFDVTLLVHCLSNERVDWRVIFSNMRFISFLADTINSANVESNKLKDQKASNTIYPRQANTSLSQSTDIIVDVIL